MFQFLGADRKQIFVLTLTLGSHRCDLRQERKQRGSVSPDHSNSKRP